MGAVRICVPIRQRLRSLRRILHGSAQCVLLRRALEHEQYARADSHAHLQA
jgi:hypothetical protein